MDRRRSLLKIAALRTEREHQQGVKMGYNQYVDKSTSTMFKSPSMPIGTNDFTLEYFGNLYGAISSNTPLIFNANSPYAYSKGCLLVYGTPKIAVRWIIFEKPSSGDLLLDSIDLIEGVQDDILHIVLTRKGTTVKVYINGELKATKEQSAVKDLEDFRLGMANSSDMIMSRIYNYALSAEEVATHYNNGDPAGYVLPAAMKGLTPVEIVGENSYTWTGVDDPVYMYTVRCSRHFKNGEVYKIRVIISNWEAGGPPYFKIATNNTVIMFGFTGNGTYEVYITAEGTPYDYIYAYAGHRDTDRRMTITVDSVEPLGCIAEYLPQNLVGQRDDKPIEITGDNSFTWTGVDDPNYAYNVRVSEYFTIDNWYKIRITVSNYEAGDSPFLKIATSGSYYLPDFKGDGVYETYAQAKGSPYRAVYLYAGQLGTDRRMTITVDSVESIPGIVFSWLDSAKQLPLNDEYLPPLLQSDGGYDLTASGMPEIIIK